ncbi:MAG: hypothetical protein IPP65_12000 [Chlorobi bacterium]|nr:hypothetical protein [Chlorobiota bacterium]
MISCSIFLYFVFWIINKNKINVTLNFVFIIAIVSRLIVLPMNPTLSDDAYRFLWDGRLIVNNVNPYKLVPSDSGLKIFQDELYNHQAYPNFHTVYPPLTQFFFAISYYIGKLFSSNLLSGFFVLKIIFFIFELLSIVLLYKIINKIKKPNNLLILYAWNPLVIIEICGQGHTDGLWVFSMLAFLYYFSKNKRALSALFLSFGVSFRILPIILFPLFIKFNKNKKLLVSIVLIVSTLFLCIPLLELESLINTVNVLKKFTNYFEFNGGVYYLIKFCLDLFHIKPSNYFTGLTLSILTIVITLLITFKKNIYKLDNDFLIDLINRILIILTIQISFSAKVHVWYYITPLCISILSNKINFRNAWLWMCCIAPLTYYKNFNIFELNQLIFIVIEWLIFFYLIFNKPIYRVVTNLFKIQLNS